MVKVALKTKDLQTILAKKNKSQNWLAYRMEVSSGYMSQLMSGERRPSPRMREKFLSALPECKFDDLFEILNHHGRSRQRRNP